MEFRFTSNNKTLFGNIATNNTNGGIYSNASSSNTLTGKRALRRFER
ncbi:MAG: NosD domain-containing protein [Candidatus Methanospirareceae archaeon]